MEIGDGLRLGGRGRGHIAKTLWNTLWLPLGPWGLYARHGHPCARTHTRVHPLVCRICAGAHASGLYHGRSIKYILYTAVVTIANSLKSQTGFPMTGARAKIGCAVSTGKYSAARFQIAIGNKISGVCLLTPTANISTIELVVSAPLLGGDITILRSKNALS